MDSTKIFGPGTKFYGIREKDDCACCYWFADMADLILLFEQLARDLDNQEAVFQLTARTLTDEEIERGAVINEGESESIN